MNVLSAEKYHKFGAIMSVDERMNLGEKKEKNLLLKMKVYLKLIHTCLDSKVDLLLFTPHCYNFSI